MPSAFRPYPLPSDWDARRRHVMRRDGGRCAVIQPDGTRCQLPATTVDHIRAVREGGSHELENLRAICQWHHRKKTSAEGNRARKRVTQQHPREPHPGIIRRDQL